MNSRGGGTGGGTAGGGATVASRSFDEMEKQSGGIGDTRHAFVMGGVDDADQIELELVTDVAEGV